MENAGESLPDKVVFIRIGRDENNGDAMTVGDQPILQLNSIQSRHVQVGDKARRVVDLLRFEKFVGGLPFRRDASLQRPAAKLPLSPDRSRLSSQCSVSVADYSRGWKCRYGVGFAGSR